MSEMRTPLGKVRGLGSAREGTGHFWRLRLTSVALLPLSLFAVGLTLSLIGADYGEVRSALAQPFVALLLALFIVIGLDHMRLGMQEIIEDYAHSEAMRMGLIMLNIFFSVAVGAVALFAVAKLALAG
jgi:succinate dehydrogenase / fumarate reductase, membrane anchor subunit